MHTLIFVKLLLDTFFPCDNRTSMLIFAQLSGKQIWAPLVEKAFAKLFGFYEALHGGSCSDAFRMLTGMSHADSAFQVPVNKSHRGVQINPETTMVESQT